MSHHEHNAEHEDHTHAHHHNEEPKKEEAVLSEETVSEQTTIETATDLVPEAPKQFVITTPIAVLIGAVVIALALLVNGALRQGEATKAKTVAQQVGLNSMAFKKCVADRKYQNVVQKDSESGATIFGNLPPEQQGTPFTLILTGGKTFSVIGYRPLDAMTQAIEKIKKGDFDLAALGIAEVSFPVPPVEKTDHMIGNKNAAITLVEYSDLECPYCARFHPVLEDLVKKYPTDLLWIYRHFPLDSIHPHARAKAEAAECAFAQGGEKVFWDYIEKLFELKIPKDTFDAGSL